MKKRILAALLSMSMMLALVASCGDKDTTSTSTGTGTSTGTVAGDTTTDEVERVTEITLPITEEKMEFSEWRSWQNDYMTNYGEVKGTQKIEELTNIHIDYTCVPTAAATEKFGLLLASAEYPDMMFNVTYPGGPDTAVSDGVFRDMTDAVWYYMPNYYNVMKNYDDAKLLSITDEGKNVGIYMIRAYADGHKQESVIECEPCWTGMTVRRDWLEELNMEAPRTIDELHEVLVAFRDNYGSWMHMYKDGTIGQDYILSAYGVTADFYLEADGKTVGYGPITDAYKTYVTLMRDWYAEGLIDPDFISTDSTAILTDNQYFANNKCGVGISYQGTCGSYHLMNGYTENEDMWLLPIQGPVLNEGDETVTTFQSNVALSPTFVSTSVTDEELPYLAKWIDWHYTYDYNVIQGYGVEGESFHVDPESEYYYVYEDAIKYPENMTPTAMNFHYALFNNTGFMDWKAAWQFYPISGNDFSQLAYETWGKQKDTVMLPSNASFTSDEGNEYNSIFVDIETYTQEMTVQFILGTLDIDSNWDNYVSTIEGMNVARCIELKQASVDRYFGKTWALEGRE